MNGERVRVREYRTAPGRIAVLCLRAQSTPPSPFYTSVNMLSRTSYSSTKRGLQIDRSPLPYHPSTDACSVSGVDEHDDGAPEDVRERGDAHGLAANG